MASVLPWVVITLFFLLAGGKRAAVLVCAVAMSLAALGLLGWIVSALLKRMSVSGK